MDNQAAQPLRACQVLQGNEACVEGALLAGCRFFAGYPITPASEVAEAMSQRMPEAGGIFLQMEDEIASINSIIGAAWGGKKAMTATSGPGYSLMQEGIGYAAATQTPCVIVNVMRGGPSTGQPTLASQQDVYQAKYGSHGDYEPIVLIPSSAQEAADMTIRAFNLAERYLVPVSLLLDEIVGHTRERVTLPTRPELINRTKPPAGIDYRPFEPIPALGGVCYRADFGEGRALLVDGQLHDHMGNRVGHKPAESAAHVRRICDKITQNAALISDYSLHFADDAEIMLLAYGSTARSALRAVLEGREAGMKMGLIRLKTLFPFPDALVKELGDRAKAVFVPEMNIGKIVNEVRRVVNSDVFSIPKLGGEMPTPAEILKSVREVRP
ncbi:MAG: 2-oxoacid:acceptor oxidoreductase subunit alpha [Deltaproteobacteria bacterium]|jgi:2-oxoglutarate ferredoxin oxidoreductase subunit alpha|nr:2-oxoacid:acceptor oxidoreductase subunit alpha [Deltaproteobacteria bacterium]